MPTAIDESFLALPLAAITDAALSQAVRLRCDDAAVRVQRTLDGVTLLRDGAMTGGGDTARTGVGVRVTVAGRPGFAAVAAPTPEAARDAAARAAEVARACAAIGRPPAEPVPEPVHRDATWIGPYRIDPFDLPPAERVAPLAEWSRRLRAAPEVAHVHAKLVVARENKYYADLAGTVTVQQRPRIHPQLIALGVDPATDAADTLRTLGPPMARGWEYLNGEGWDWEREIAELPGHLAAKLRAPAIEPGRHDLLIDPSNLWLTLHETVGHATELDRAAGHEIGYAGGSFAAPELLGSLRYGSAAMNVSADRTAAHGLATVGFDDEGVAARSWGLVTAGVLTGFQTDRRTARLVGAGRSTGCAYAESALHAPLSRMPNVSLLPDQGGPSTAELIEGVSDGVYVVGSDSWSIDTRRRRFQFTAQRCHLIRHGRLAGQVRDVAYGGETTAFWGSLVAVGGPSDYRLFGADLCGKGQPLQIAPTSHGCPPALFRSVAVRNARAEAGL